MTARDEWKWTDEQGVQRVVRTDELRAAILSGRVPPSIRVWREGMNDWLPASAIPELARGLPIPSMVGSRTASERPMPPMPPPRARSAPQNPIASKEPPAAPQRPPGPRVQTLVGVSHPAEETSQMPVPKTASGRKITLKGTSAEDAHPPRVDVSAARTGKPPAAPEEVTQASPLGSGAVKMTRSSVRPPLPPAARRAASQSPTPAPAAVAPPPRDEEDDTLTLTKDALHPALPKEDVTATARIPLPPLLHRKPPSAADARTPLPPEPSLPPVELPPSPHALAAQLKASPAVRDEEVTRSVDFTPPPVPAPSPEITRTLVLEGLVGQPSGAATPAPSNPPHAGPPRMEAPQVEAPRAEKSHLPERAAPSAPAPQRAPLDDSPTAPLPESVATAPEPPARSSPSRDMRQAVAVSMSSLFGAGGALICMVVASFFVGRCSVSSGPGHAMLPARAGLRVAHVMAVAAIPPPPKPCWVSKQPVMWAPKASKSIPFELLTSASGTLAVGYASDSNRAVGIDVVPSTGKVTEKFSQNVPGGIERVTPAESGAGFMVVTSGESGPLRSVVNVPAKTPFAIGLAGGALSLADSSAGAPSTLWPIEGDRPLDAVRVLVAGDSGFPVTFRRDGAIWSGWIAPDRKPSGALTKVVGSSGAVGKPMIGWNRRELAIVFADRPATNAAWQIRAGRAPTGSVPASTVVIDLPPGGPGGDAFAPDIAGLPDGRWLLLWTEGPPGSKAIRAQTLAPDFAPVGDPIALSPPAGSFGQGALGVSGGYVAAVFLSKGSESFELWGAVLQCG